ncbi:hypothetical protein IV203_002882 [Nitzschia inconspicua]|uniref:PH domain-containing protein n=1 Tax=Nitzschia inconspicua TaxID=303405 RepID=A0A9K3L193_9STRA|nr:hypothetical protein IV203_002882 [Nitzschia inconspicua]
MASMSVKDRAKLFGDLANSNVRGDSMARGREFGNNVVSSSPFLAGNSPRSTTSGPVTCSPISVASPKSAVSVPYQRKDHSLSYGSYGNLQRKGQHQNKSPGISSSASRNGMEWPEEDSIPAPNPVVSTKKSSYRSDRKIDNLPEYLSKPIVLPTNASPINFPPQSPNWSSKKTKNVQSPLKSVPNNQENGGFSSPKTTSGTVQLTQWSKMAQENERLIIHSETKRLIVKETVESGHVSETLAKLRESPDDLSSNRSFVSDSENNAPENVRFKPKSSRVMRLMRAKRATSPAPTMSVKLLKSSLTAAKAVMEEEKSVAGSSNASSRSSLSNRELSDIASRALKMAASSGSPMLEEERPGSVRGRRTISNVSHQEARLALLNAAKRKNSDGDYKDSCVRLSEKTPEPNENGSKNLGIPSCGSIDSNKSRRLDHPAFAGRASPMPKAKVSSADIMSSFREFNNLRKNTTKSPGLATPAKRTQESDQTGSKFYIPAVKALSDSLNRDSSSTTPKSKKEPVGKSRDDRLSTESGDNSMASQSSFLEQEETMHSMKHDDTMHDSVQQDESMHSMTDREYLDGFYQMGRLHVIAKSRVNEAYLSSLSSNTWTTQSIMSQSLASSMKSPVGKLAQSEKKAFLLEPTPEYSNQTMKSEILIGLSPGPSNRSTRSFANSIVSASPNSARQSPTFDADFDAFFKETLEPIESFGQGSDKDSAELLDAAIDAAVDDIIMKVAESKDDEHDQERKRKEDANDWNKIRTIEQPKETIVPAVIISPKMRVVGTKSVSILPNASGRSNSPPGFIFNDSEESDVVLPPDPTGMSEKDGFVLPEKSFGPSNHEDEAKGSSGASDKSDQSFGSELKLGVLKVDSSHEFSVDFEPSFPSSKNDEADKKGSSSSKKTVSTSIRTGFSSIQDEPVEGFEGSASIRTGLSGLQECQDKSISFRAEKSAFVVLSSNPAKNLIQSKTPKMPDTIPEEADAASLPIAQPSPEMREQETLFSELKSKDDTTSFSGYKPKSTSTTDGSSGSRSAFGDSETSELISSYSCNDTGHYTGFETAADKDSVDKEENEPLFKSILPPIQTDEDEEASATDKGTSLLTPSSRKSGGAPWKGGNFGKRVGDAIKNVLAKASPRAIPSLTPSGHGKGAKQQDSRSLFSSVDDDDDIFGGLEDDNTVENKNACTAPKTPKDTAKTPKQRNSKAANKSPNTPSSKNGKTPKNEIGFANAFKMPSHILPPKKQNRKSSSPSGDPASMYSDRSGTVVDESEVLHVHSDITSSLIGGPVSTPPNPSKSSTSEKIKKDGINVDEKAEKLDKRSSPTSKSKSSRKSKSSKSTKSDKKNASGRKAPKSKTEVTQETRAEEVLRAEEEKPGAFTFMRLSCGGLGDLSSGFAGLCSQNKADDLVDLEGDDDIKDYQSVSSHSRLTDLEKKVWSEWDRLNGSVIGGGMEDGDPKITERAPEKASEKEVREKLESKEKKEDHEKKREAARDKLLDIASTALSSHLSGKTGTSTNLDGGDQGTLPTTDNIVSASASSDSGVTKDTGSGASGASASASGTESGNSAGFSSQESTHGSSTEYSSGVESDFVSEDQSNSCSSQTAAPSTASTGPILLSFSQRSLMEKFSKQLTAVGVEVLKLNRRKQWQTRYFTVSKEQIALSAHEAISQTGELAHCPKALLWLKKFNPKNGGYGITNIDKDGHGGMLLVDLVEIQVSDAKSESLENPLPKKLMEKFKESVLVTLRYKMNGMMRSIEFRSKDNDEAQFLCTCMRVIRDLLRRERSLRQKSNKLEQKKTSAKTLSSGNLQNGN